MWWYALRLPLALCNTVDLCLKHRPPGGQMWLSAQRGITCRISISQRLFGRYLDKNIICWLLLLSLVTLSPRRSRRSMDLGETGQQVLVTQPSPHIVTICACGENIYDLLSRQLSNTQYSVVNDGHITSPGRLILQLKVCTFWTPSFHFFHQSPLPLATIHLFFVPMRVFCCWFLRFYIGNAIYFAFLCLAYFL